MRNILFVAEHRGGPLKKEQHHQLILWARDCSLHVLPLLGDVVDERLVHALDMADKWAEGCASVGDARKASVGAHAVARECPNPIAVAVARSVGHAVATAHMADHSLGAALYALKAVNRAGRSVEAERKWQTDRLPQEIAELALSGLREKEKAFKL